MVVGPITLLVYLAIQDCEGLFKWKLRKHKYACKYNVSISNQGIDGFKSSPWDSVLSIDALPKGTLPHRLGFEPGNFRSDNHSLHYLWVTMSPC